MKFMQWMAAIFVGFAFMFSSLRPAQAQPAMSTITIHAKKFQFDPSEITLKQGQMVNLIFVSDDVPHGIAFDGIDIHAEFRKHHSAQVSLTPTKLGDFEGRCSVFCGAGHDTMKLIIHVAP